MTTRNCFRCPDCWKTFQSAAMVEDHMGTTQGGCFDKLPSWAQRNIRNYHNQFSVPHSLRFSQEEFEVIE